ncbi:lipoprotein LpqH [Mycobacterium seoulense]|uniref:lipoprotein LpqH n=1 Tax=Mycobacterium seoulense TaxID=386911 RepID=UPI003CF00206
MRDRIAAAVAAALAVTVVGACTPQPPTRLASTASVTVNGNETKFNVVKCGQVQWTRTIDIGGDFAGARIVVDEQAESVSAESVHLRNVSGFTGMYSRGGEGDADARLSGDRFTITGTAHGYKSDKPNEPDTATFKITVAC